MNILKSQLKIQDYDQRVQRVYSPTGGVRVYLGLEIL